MQFLTLMLLFVYRINYLFAGGFYPVGFHVINIILHCIISVLMVDVFSILLGGLQFTNKGRRLNLAPKTSLLAALLFAVHPVHTECVSNEYLTLKIHIFRSSWLSWLISSDIAFYSIRCLYIFLMLLLVLVLF